MEQTSTNMAVTACTMRCLRLSKVGANHVTKSFLYCRHFCTSTKNTVDEEEIEKLSRKTSDWWSPNGEFAALHSMNKLRVPFIKKSLEHIHTQTFTPSKPLRGSRILDVGCGGGILSESLARLGAEVTGVDASARNIHAALRHAHHDPMVADRVQYKCTTVEELADEEPESFDCVVASEVIEHVTDKDTFISASTQLVKPGGSLVITTINQTVLSYAAAIVGAEYILRLVTPGTHDWNKFVSVDDLSSLISQSMCMLNCLQPVFSLSVRRVFMGTWNAKGSYGKGAGTRLYLLVHASLLSQSLFLLIFEKKRLSQSSVRNTLVVHNDCPFWLMYYYHPLIDGAEVIDVRGMSYIPFFNKWCWIEDTSVNFALRAIKPEEMSPEVTSDTETNTET